MKIRVWVKGVDVCKGPHVLGLHVSLVHRNHSYWFVNDSFTISLHMKGSTFAQGHSVVDEVNSPYRPGVNKKPSTS